MLDKPEAIADGIAVLERFIPGAEKIIFGIEKNKPDCIDKMTELFAANGKVSVISLPSLYPQGAEKVIIHNTTGLVVPEGKLPVDIGVLVINVTSLAVLGNYFKTGMPLVEKCVTVDGSAVKEPKNVIVPIGTSIRDVLEFVGVDTDAIGKVLFGGPMMGTAVYSLDEPVTKRNNAITVMSISDAKEREQTACIHCGRCVASCPMSLNPTVFAKALSLGTEDKIARLDEGRVNLCMECGCCSYVCPANRPLVQNNRLAKTVLRDYKAHQATLKQSDEKEEN
jgi:electron transport complex protein RnfC